MPVRVKTFTQTLEIFKTHKELDDLDERVNDFISKEGVKKVISVCDTTTNNVSGSTMGVIRVLTYEV